jgi:hypothetical protein
MKTWLMRRAVRTHQFVGVKATLHEQFALAGVDQLHRARGRRFTVLRVNQFTAGDIEIVLPGDRLNLGSRADQNGIDEAQARGFKAPAQ